MNTILNYLYGTYAPRTMILYGSYADGTNNEGSDFDAIILADHKPYHDVSIIGGVQLDVFVYPVDYFARDEQLEETEQIADGIILHDPDGLGAALCRRVQAYVAAQPPRSAEENAESIAWCRKMLVRSGRGDPEGYFRWHWVLMESLPIACDLLALPWRGPKKSLLSLEQACPDVYAVYARALAEFTPEALSAWINCLEELL